MKLEKVVEILELNLKEAGKKMPPDTATALRISIAAVNELQLIRKTYPAEYYRLLPGETQH